MAWSAEQQISNGQTITNTAAYGGDSVAVPLLPGETAQVQIKCAFAASSTKDLLIRVLASYDGSRWDTLPYGPGASIGNKANSYDIRTLTIRGVKMFKLQYAQSTAENYTYTVDAWVVTDGINAA